MKSLKQKILIFGPIGDFGGRELEAGFVASVLATSYEVAVCSTGRITKESQVFDFDEKLNAFSVKEIVYKKYGLLKILAFISYLKNNKKGSAIDYVNNALSKKYLGYEDKVKTELEKKIVEYDAIFIIAQLSSNLIDFVIQKAKEHTIKVLFRTTGAIQKAQNLSFLNQVDLFIHHSENNAKRLAIANHKYVLIDQCAYGEASLLKIPLLKSRVKSFLTIARLEKEKNVEVVIEAFLKVKKEGDMLYVIGSGTELANLKHISKNDDSIQFTGFVSNTDLHQYFSKVDCVILPHYNLETGPLTGIEAMASGRMILSSKTGAMPERLKGFEKVWFENSIEGLSKSILELKEMNESEVCELSKNIKRRYLEYYSKNEIRKKYFSAVSGLLVKRDLKN